MCYTHFGKMIKSAGKSQYDDNSEEKLPDEENDECSQSDDDDDFIDDEVALEKKFHYIITEDDELGYEIPNYIKLKDPLPKENPIMKKRTLPAAERSINQTEKTIHTSTSFQSSCTTFPSEMRRKNLGLMIMTSSRTFT